MNFLNCLVIILVVHYEPVSAFPNLIDQLTANGATTLVSLIDQAGLTDTLKTSGPYTILAPTEAAFQKVPAQDLSNLQADVAALKDVLLFHVVNGEVFSFDLKTGEHVTSLNGHVLRLRSYSGHHFFNEVSVLKEDIQASNGVIYLVDEVLEAPEGTIWKILNNPDYHLSTFANITGRAHKDLRLNSTATTTRYTVFAPTDDAFSKLSPGALANLMSSEMFERYLTDYHTHKGMLHASDIFSDGDITTMHTGYTIRFQYNRNTDVLLLNEKSHVIIRDIEADNGIVHIISQILIPPKLGTCSQ